MNWHRTHNRIWESDCGRYEINALIKLDSSGFDYAAMYRHQGINTGLGIFRAADSVVNAKAAQAACEQHAEKQPCK